MNSHHSNYITIVFILVLFLFMGCNSTDSNSDSNPPTNFSSGTIGPGETYNYTFENKGDIEYYCDFHAPDMQGEITVTSSADSAERDTVIMENEQFQPSSLSVAPNTEVVWINNQDVDHTVTSGNPSGGDDGGGPDY